MFKMNFNNYNTNIRQVAPRPVQPVRMTATSLNSPMIGRVYNAKAGCGSCGKKIA